MRIEKITNNIIKVTISKADFATRNIDSMHLKVQSRLYKNFISDIVAHAESELGFETCGGQLMVETKPGSKPGEFVVFVRGLESIEQLDKNMSNDLAKMDGIINSLARKLDNVQKKLPPENEFGCGDDCDCDSCDDCDDQDDDKLPSPMDIFKTLGLKFPGAFPEILPDLPSQKSDNGMPRATEVDPEDLERKNRAHETFYDSYDVIAFEQFKDLESFCVTYKTKIKASSELYEYNDTFFLVLKLSKTTLASVNKIESRALEFNGIFVPAEYILPILYENGKIIFKKAAIKSIAEIFG